MERHCDNCKNFEQKESFDPRDVWPKFEDGTYINFGDSFLDGIGNEHVLYGIEIVEQYPDKHIKHINLMGNRYSITGEPYDGICMFVQDRGKVQRPESDMVCYNDSLKADSGVFLCSHCGIHLDIADMGEEDMDVFYQPKFCPNCNLRVVSR